jgi:leucyl-tRNA synthetase
MKRYNPKDIEPKWQNSWQEQGIYKAIDFSDKPKYVMLTEFPYPSGDGLHLGHVREYTLGDIIARYKRMKGHNVLYPMGYDAFGLPTENYAIKNKIAPQVATDQNVGNFQKQFNSLGYSIDWDRSFRTTDPSYYRWTQWLFLQFYKKGLAYQDEIAINWCPHCKTGLANEEVVNGRHERCDTLVEKKLLKQWILKITHYADRLIDGLQTVDYPSRIADQQVNWIGRSNGAQVTFKVDGHDAELEVFTTAHDTIYGVTFMVLAPEHPLVGKIVTDDHKDKVNSYVKSAASKSEIERQDTSKEKTGVPTGAHVIHPLTGERVPVWVADYVLAGYGTGAIMAVPGEDERDYAFAKKYNLPVVYTTDKNEFTNYQTDIKPNRKTYTLANSGAFNGLDFEEGRQKILEKLIDLGVGTEKVQYKLRDWIFSRQHYWGEPIPVIHCSEHGAVPVPEDQLPVTLPDVDNYEPTDTGESPLAAISEWVNTTCPVCNGPAKRETDTMPNWAGSSWYYLRYFDAHNDTAFADRAKLEYWQDVDLYLGGMEHTTLHLLYSRFWHQFLFDEGLVPTPEPYAARRGQGIILAADGSKMSKSKGNVINPNDIIDQGYGADALRTAIAFLAPYDQTTPWSPESVPGTYRFINRLWTLVQESHSVEQVSDAHVDAKLQKIAHATAKKVSEDFENMNFNTAIAALMEAVNGLFKIKADHGYGAQAWQETLETVVALAAPIIPHAAEEMWHDLGQETSVHSSDWPSYDEKHLVSDEITFVVQVNGKVRANIVVSADASKDEVIALAQADEKVATYIADGIKKTIFVPAKLVNFVA